MESIGKLLNTILTHYEKKEYEAADAAADRLLAAAPGFHRAEFMKAVILEETGRQKEAEDHYAKAGNRFTLWLRLAVQLLESDPERAVLYFERVSKMDPANNMIWFHLGSIHEKAGRIDLARACFRNLSPAREVVSKILTPLGFILFLTGGAAMMIQRGERGLVVVVIASALFCLFWLKRDAGTAVQMLRKKRASR